MNTAFVSTVRESKLHFLGLTLTESREEEGVSRWNIIRTDLTDVTWQTSYCKFIITILKWNVWNQQQNCAAAVFVVSCNKNWLQQTGSLRPVICPILSKLAHSESAALVSHSFGHSSIAAQLYFHTRLSLHHSRPVQPVHITTSPHHCTRFGNILSSEKCLCL